MNYKIPYSKFLETFNKKQIEDICEYEDVMKLHKQGYSRKQILKKRRVSLDKLQQWRNTSIKPIPIKILEKAEERGYFKVFSGETLEFLAYLIGFNLGDGNVSKNLCNVWFYGVNSDLEKIKDKFLEFGVHPVIYTYKVNNGKMAIHDHVFSRLLLCFGAVSGDKTKSSYSIPEWILKNKSLEIKRKFLQGFFDSELSSLKIPKHRIFGHDSMKLYSVKHKEYIKNGVLFLNQIKSLLKEFQVSSSEVKLDREYIRSRDNGFMQQLFIIIYANYINLYNFIKNIGFLYNSKRRDSSLKDFVKIKTLAEEEINKIKKYEKAIKLRKIGMSAYEIAKKLNIKVYHIKNWIYFKKKPRLYDFVKS